MTDIDWSKAPEGFPIWIESLGGMPGTGWHRDDGDRWVDRTGSYWPKGADERGNCRVHLAPWSGDGLPPVGTVCECRVKANSPWVQCEVVAHHKQYAIAYVDDDTVMLSCGIRFRPIKTPAQIAAEEREAAIKAMWEIYWQPSATSAKQALGLLWDAGLRLPKGEEQ